MTHVHAFHTFMRGLLTFRLGHVHALPVPHEFVDNVFKQIRFNSGEVLDFVVFARRCQLLVGGPYRLWRSEIVSLWQPIG